MKVAIDMDKMRVVAVHRVQDILHGLVFLEARNVRNVLFDDTDRAAFLDRMATLELTLLLRNLTGQEFPPQYDNLARRDAIATAIGKMKDKLVDERELDLQIEAVQEQLRLPIGKVPQFRYVLGAKVPKIEDGGLSALAANPLTADELQASATAQRRSARPAPYTPNAAEPRTAPALQAPRAAGSVRPVIRGVADRMWEAAGKPTDKASVLELRKKMMAELEEQHGVKRTSSSTSLGEWQKDRLG